MTADMVFDGARVGDGVCISVVRDTTKYVGMAIVNLAAVLDPEAIVLGGTLASAGDMMLEAIRLECTRRLRPSAGRTGSASSCRRSARRGGDWRGARAASRADDPAGGRDHRPAGSRARPREPAHRRRPHRGDRDARHRRARGRDAHRRSASAFILPGFVDVHVHGVEGHDVLDGAGAVGEGRGASPALRRDRVLPDVDRLHAVRARRDARGRGARTRRDAQVAARVLPAHLESNFINPEYKGAQPIECLRIAAVRSARPTVHGTPSPARDRRDRSNGIAHRSGSSPWHRRSTVASISSRLTAAATASRSATRAPPTNKRSTAIDAGVTHATHLFNRMSPMSHRAPGVPGAVLTSERVAGRSDLRRLSRASVAPARRDSRERCGWRSWPSPTAPPGPACRSGSRTRLGGRPIRRRRAHGRTRRRHGGRQRPDHGRRRSGRWCGRSACHWFDAAADLRDDPRRAAGAEGYGAHRGPGRPGRPGDPGRQHGPR